MDTVDVKATHQNKPVKNGKKYKEDDRDDAMVSLIYGLNFLINKANSSGMYGAARTLQNAKEDLVYWAVQMNFHETPEEKFINKYLYNYSEQNTEELKSYVLSGTVDG